MKELINNDYNDKMRIAELESQISKLQEEKGVLESQIFFDNIVRETVKEEHEKIREENKDLKNKVDELRDAVDAIFM